MDASLERLSHPTFNLIKGLKIFIGLMCIENDLSVYSGV